MWGRRGEHRIYLDMSSSYGTNERRIEVLKGDPIKEIYEYSKKFEEIARTKDLREKGGEKG